MEWLAWTVLAAVGLPLLWASAPLDIALLAVALAVLVLGGAGQWLWRRSTGQGLPLWAWWLVLMCASLTGLAVLVALPERLSGAPFMALGIGGVAATWTAALVWFAGWLGVARRPVPAPWWAVVALAAAAVLLAAWLAPAGRAQAVAWHMQLRGYQAVPLRIVLAAPQASQGISDAQREQALLQLVRPLLDQGGRDVPDPQASRSSRPAAQARVPARYRFHGGALEIMLADSPPTALLRAHVALLEQFAAGAGHRPQQAPSWTLLAATQCLPAPRLQELGRLGGAGELVGRARRCTQQRSEQLQQLWPVLAASVQQIDTGPAQRFSPWPAWPLWQAAPLPEAVRDGAAP